MTLVFVGGFLLILLVDQWRNGCASFEYIWHLPLPDLPIPLLPGFCSPNRKGLCAVPEEPKKDEEDL